MRCYDVSMRTTVRVDDGLLEELKERARRDKVSLTRLLNRTIKAGLRAATAPGTAQDTYREDTHHMGPPKIALDKALALAAAIEDEDIVRELAVGR